MHLLGVHLMGVYLTGVHLMGMHLMDVHLIGVHLIDVYLINVYRPLSFCSLRAQTGSLRILAASRILFKGRVPLSVSKMTLRSILSTPSKKALPHPQSHVYPPLQPLWYQLLCHKSLWCGLWCCNVLWYRLLYHKSLCYKFVVVRVIVLQLVVQQALGPSTSPLNALPGSSSVYEYDTKKMRRTKDAD